MDAAEPASPTRQRNQYKQATLDIYVAKAREFESFKQMPRFSHPYGAVIHPSPTKFEKEPRHRPPKTLQFDGVPLALGARPEPRQLPEELVRPPIDEEKLFKLKEQEKMRKSQQKQGPGKRMSLTAQKQEQQLAKAKTDLSIKIKRAEKNMKNLFAELKKILEKDDEDAVFPNARENVHSAKAAEQKRHFVSFLFRAWAAGNKDVAADPTRVAKTEFVAFCRFIL